MKYSLIFAVIFFASGCTTLKPVKMSPEVLQQKIAAGEVIEVGDKVKVVTSDGTVHRFKVTESATDQVSGKGIEVPIADIVAIETREFSGLKTGVLIAGGSLVYVLLSTAVMPPSLGL
jgi:hypothetical protein